jgi:putative tryptophan/tyrosine transport system substrate-binding protein
MRQFWIFDFGFWIRRSKGKKELCLALCALHLALCLPAAAQQPAKVFRIGYLSLRNAIGPHEEAFLKGLRDLGYIDGENVFIEWRFAKGKAERMNEFAAELVRLKVDVIVAPGVQAVRAAKQSTTHNSHHLPYRG